LYAYAYSCTIVRICVSTRDVEYTDLSEDCSRAERRVDGFSIVCYDRQRPSLDDVQFFSDVSLTTDVVSWTKDDQMEGQDEVDEQTGLALVKEGDPFEGLQVDVHLDLCLELLGQRVEDLLFDARMPVVAQVVEPLDDSNLERSVDLSECQVSVFFYSFVRIYNLTHRRMFTVKV